MQALGRVGSEGRVVNFTPPPCANEDCLQVILDGGKAFRRGLWRLAWEAGCRDRWCLLISVIFGMFDQIPEVFLRSTSLRNAWSPAPATSPPPHHSLKPCCFTVLFLWVLFSSWEVVWKPAPPTPRAHPSSEVSGPSPPSSYHFSPFSPS